MHTRRAILKTGLAAASCLAMPAIARKAWAQNGEVNIMGYQGVVPDEFKASFEEKTGIKVNFRVTDDASKIYNLLVSERSNPSIDIAQMAGNRYLQFFRADLLDFLDRAQVDGWENIHPAYQDHEMVKYEGEFVGVPIQIGYQGLAFNTDRHSNFDSWKTLFDEANSGKIGLRLTDFLHVVLIYLGHDPNLIGFINDEAGAAAIVEEARDLVIRNKSLVRQFWQSGGEIQQMLVNEEVTIANPQSGHVSNLIKDGFPLKIVVPKEGSIAFNHSFGLVKGRKNAEAAYTYLSEFLKYPNIASMMTRGTGNMSTLAGAAEGLSEAEKAAYIISDEMITGLHFYSEVNGEMKRKLFNDAEALIRAA